MTRLTEQIQTYATELPEGAPISAKGLLHLGNRAAVDRLCRAWPNAVNSSARVVASIFAPLQVASAREHLRSNRRSRRA